MTFEIVLASSPNWYSSKICDVLDNFVALACKNVITLLKIDPSSSTPMAIVGAVPTSTQRITSAAFVHGHSPLLVVTASEHGMLKVWDTSSGRCMRTYRHASSEITSVSSSHCSAGLVVFGDRKGCVSTWNCLSSGESRVITVQPFGSPVTTLSCCPVSSGSMTQLCAVGCKNGMVHIINTVSGTVIEHLAGHDAEVQDISWWFRSGSVEEGFLVSTCINRYIRIYNLRDWSSYLNLRVPSPGSRKYDERKVRSWTTCTIVNSGSDSNSPLLICSGPQGDLFSCSLAINPDMGEGESESDVYSGNGSGSEKGKESASDNWRERDVDVTMKSKNQKKQKQKLSRISASGHARLIFSLNSISMPTNSNSESKSLFLTTSQDREVILWESSESVVSRSRMSTLGGFVYALATQTTAVGNERVAIACGDQSIRIWNTGQVDRHSTLLLWKGLQAKVTALEWHPAHGSNHLLYGCSDGRVGIMNVKTQKSVVFQLFHRSAVYRVGWKPSYVGDNDVGDGDGDDEFSGYSCWSSSGESRLFAHSPSNAKSLVQVPFPVLSKNEKSSRWGRLSKVTDFSWWWCRCEQKCRRLVAVGHSDGRVQIYMQKQGDQQEVLLYSERLHMKLIHRLVWYAEYGEDACDCSRLWLASCSDSPKINVIDVTSLLQPQQEHVPQPEVEAGAEVETESPVKSVSLPSVTMDHGSAVYGLEWSSFKNTNDFEVYLASGSSDSTVQVWSVSSSPQSLKLKARSVSNFRGHDGRVLCLAWSVKEPGVVYSGGDDQTVRRGVVESKSENESIPAATATDEIEYRFEGGEVAQEKEVVGSSGSQGQFFDKDREKEKEKGKYKKGKAKGPLRCLPAFKDNSSTRQDALESCMQFASNDLSELDSMMFLDGPSEVCDVLRSHANLAHVDKTLPPEHSVTMEVWRGNPAAALEGNLDDERGPNLTMVALSAMGGEEAWKKMCELYAHRLEVRNDRHSAALFLIACGQVREAINVYRRGNVYREAMVLARARLLPGDPLIKQVTMECAEHMMEKMFYEHAAKCWLALGEYDRAFECILKRGDDESVDAAKNLLNVLCTSKPEQTQELEQAYAGASAKFLP